LTTLSRRSGVKTTLGVATETSALAAMRDVRTKRVGDVGYKPGVFDPELGW